ncbi:energy-coupling factor transporter ATPase [Limosilactobacillus pontis]|nr:energy-coupling factor transporter ATPase [Limosilactobacillus pontis]MDM8331692.1 energy-coupling factor transporter ATPase [Limosilactobacillus pontis]
MPEILIKNVSFSYAAQNARPALDDVSLRIAPGSFVGIVGHTGSGKSTLVSLIDGLGKPTSGQIQVGTVTVDAQSSPADLAQLRRHVGYVFQFPEQQLFAETVGQDIAFGPTNLGWSTDRVQAAVQEALKLVGLPAAFADRSPFALSGGQMRRAAIAGVLAMKPAILILDEPTAGLDAAATERLLTNVAQLHAAGTTILLITHQMDQVARYADQVVVMNQGHLVKSAPPREIFVDPAFLAANHLNVPAAVAMSHQLRDAGVKIDPALSIDALADQLAAKLGGKHGEQ